MIQLNLKAHSCCRVGEKKKKKRKFSNDSTKVLGRPPMMEILSLCPFVSFVYFFSLFVVAPGTRAELWSLTVYRLVKLVILKTMFFLGGEYQAMEYIKKEHGCRCQTCGRLSFGWLCHLRGPRFCSSLKKMKPHPPYTPYTEVTRRHELIDDLEA